jgi:hypothetical protein
MPEVVIVFAIALVEYAGDPLARILAGVDDDRILL